MNAIQLTEGERQELQSIIRQTKDANQLRRGLAMQWVDESRSVPEIARWLQVNSATIYRWVELFQMHDDWAMEERLGELPRGRPRKLREEEPRKLSKEYYLAQLAKEICQSPKTYGHSEYYWTLESLTKHFNSMVEPELSITEVKNMVDKIMKDGRIKTHFLR